MYFDMFGLSTLLGIREALGDTRLLPLRHEERFVSVVQELELAIRARIEGSEPTNRNKDFPLPKTNEEDISSPDIRPAASLREVWEEKLENRRKQFRKD